jgi:hypothetical protein
LATGPTLCLFTGTSGESPVALDLGPIQAFGHLSGTSALGDKSGQIIDRFSLHPFRCAHHREGFQHLSKYRIDTQAFLGDVSEKSFLLLKLSEALIVFCLASEKLIKEPLECSVVDHAGSLANVILGSLSLVTRL